MSLHKTDKELCISLPRILRAISSERLFNLIDFHIADNPTDIIMDASETHFIDSSAVGKMIILSRRLQKRSCSFVISNASADLTQYFQHLRITDFFRMT